MRKATLSLAVLASFGTIAAFSTEVDPVYQIRVDSAVYSPDAFIAKGFSAQRMIASIPAPDALPTREQREALFDKVPGLNAHLKKFDGLERDLLYVRARMRPFDELKAKYPKIDAEVLKNLQAAFATPSA
jgi:hypothetical protein